MSVRKTGNWDAVFQITKNLDKDIQMSMIKTIRKVTLYAEAKVLKHMRDQDLNWVPYRNSNYAGNKSKKGLSSKMLYATSTMFQSITSYVKGDEGAVGVKRETKSKDGKKVWSIAAVQEFGSERQNIDARPLWRPTLKETYVHARRKNWASKSVLDKLLKRSKK